MMMKKLMTPMMMMMTTKMTSDKATLYKFIENVGLT